MMLIWVFIIGVIFWAIFSAKGIQSQKESALDIAQRRYARGEITKKELDDIKKDIPKN